MQPTVVIEARKGIFNIDLQAVYEYRELLYFLIWRDLKVRYKQTMIGIGWVALQPLITMIIFTTVFGYFAKLPSDGMPYTIFTYTALLPWNYFATALSRSISSVVGDSHLVSKIYFPRLILPLSGAISGMVDFCISFILLICMLTWHRIGLTLAVFMLPVFLLLALLTALSIGLWLSALNVRYRDIGYTVPFLIQIWMFASPVIYPVSLVPQQYRSIYGLNPMVGVIEGFRWALLGKSAPDFSVISISVLVVLLIFVGGLVFFRKMELTFADII